MTMFWWTEDSYNEAEKVIPVQGNTGKGKHGWVQSTSMWEIKEALLWQTFVRKQDNITN